MRLQSQLRRTLFQLFTEREAASAVMTALMLPILIGFIGLSIDVGAWQMNKHRLQGGVDSAAYSVAVATTNEANKQQAVAEGKGVLASMGYIDGANGAVISIQNPPTAGNYSGNLDAWEVTASMPQQMYFTSLFIKKSPNITVRAVALANKNPGWGCILSLHPTMQYATSFTNNADVPETCDVYTNSGNSRALQCENNCDIYGNAYTVGGNYATNHGTLHGVDNQTGVDVAPNPYADLPVPVAASLPCTLDVPITAKGASPSMIYPGVYCGGIDVATNRTLTMMPGVYYIRTKFNLNGNSTLNATDGVTIVLLDDLCIGTGTCEREKGIGNNVTINLEAPTEGAYAGVALYAVGTGSTVKMQEFSNNVNLNVVGAMYAPHHMFAFHNNAQFNSGMCAQVVSLVVVFENNADMGSNCEGTGVRKIKGHHRSKTSMVE